MGNNRNPVERQILSVQLSYNTAGQTWETMETQ